MLMTVSARPKNRLIHEASPYLQQHAANPVDWHPWGKEALETAKRLDKPILLSIGYSACHWCHVMERESFEDDDVAKVMNEHFVNVKVDREERPDLDQIYQLVVQLMGRSGGWPLTVFLTPDQKPFFGGTYFPPIDKYGMPGFPKILQAVSDAYRTQREDVVAQADELANAIAKVGDSDATHAYAPALDLLERATSTLARRFDDRVGGFGDRPKFPSTMALEVLLRRGALEGDTRSLARVRQALDAMRAGGVYDQLGGGFHRYSTDAAWLVPHFEKMLYDNALLLRLYVDAFRVTREERYALTAREIVSYTLREMTDADGGFYATQDADSEGEEGRFFVWSPAQIAELLSGDEEAAKVAAVFFGVTTEGNFEESGMTVLHEAKSIADVAIQLGLAPSVTERALSRAKAALFLAREKRIKPFRDEKILASWNGLMIGALAEAGGALADRAMIAAAERAFAFVESRLVIDDADGDRARVLRHAKGAIVKGPGFLDDHAFVADAALDLYEVTGDPRYVRRARAIADAMVHHFADTACGGFYFAPDDGEALIHRAKDPYDHAIPSGTSIACKLLLRLGALTDAKHVELATKELERLAPMAVENPFGASQTVCVLDRLVRGSVDVVIVGARDDARTRALADVVLAAYVPNRTLAWADPANPDALDACHVVAEGKALAAAGRDAPIAYVCRGRTCSLPIADAGALARELARGA
jgi:uncharacterized protein YyaL (SSP411 family)